ncbi:M48 family metallopeptidase [Oryzicola mucosus]|uniref:M48 family metallopeptidase n=1 Tax=Oryzicola mucosus TaxID=2767425 RepID=UPI001E328AAB|nr:M48 family metallopeptidase [Oryzicola mucosus]
MASETPALTGLWREAGQARAKEARLEVDEAFIAAVLDAEAHTLATAPLRDADVSARIGSIARRVTFPDGSVFETKDNDGIDRLLRGAGSRTAGVVSGLEQFRPRLIAFVLLTIVFCVAIYRYAVPALVEVAIWATPPAVTTAISQSVMVSLDNSVFAESTLPEARRKALSDGFSQLSALTPRGETQTPGSPAYTLNFRRGGSIGPNAFALPDGTVVLTDELVELAGSDDEIVLGVLAHEIGHVDHEHSLRQLYEAAGTAGLIMLIGGDIGAGTEDLLTQGAALVALSHSRGAEREADRFSVELMHKAGRDPAAVARFFELLQKKLGDTGSDDFLSTHPATPERIAETRRYAKEIEAAGK